jgi:hypothetical protein
MFGIPKEGYGFSSGAKVTMSALRFLMLYFHMMGTSANVCISSLLNNTQLFFPKQSTFNPTMLNMF